jgi:hypothetical protein
MTRKPSKIASPPLTQAEQGLILRLRVLSALEGARRDGRGTSPGIGRPRATEA